MKKIILKKQIEKVNIVSKNYKIDYKSLLNEQQFEAVFHNQGAALVIAGAGTGKTRVLVFRVARLIEDGVAPESILLLTFTRKSASEMLKRANELLDNRTQKIQASTFHSFAMLMLRHYANVIGYTNNFNIIDQTDVEDTINLIRSNIITKNISFKKRRLPSKVILAKIYSTSVNKRTTIKEVVENEYKQFCNELDFIELVINEYSNYKIISNAMDYDDLLINLLKLLSNYPKVLNNINNKYLYTMVDEYQDTNRLQHEIVLLLSGKSSNVMAVGDDAQSIYSFRGADYQNIFFFPESFANCKVYKIEENYRSTKEILDLTNVIINSATYKYKKNLFSNRTINETPKLISTKNESQQSEFLVQQILELVENGTNLNEIAVLFRSGFHSFDLEIQLNVANIPFVKYGGMKFIETAHVKDVLCLLKILNNPKDYISWQRILLFHKGIGQVSVNKIIQEFELHLNDLFDSSQVILKGNNYDQIYLLLKFLADLKTENYAISTIIDKIIDYYKPLMSNKFEDSKKREKDFTTFVQIAEKFNTIQQLLNEFTLEPPVESLSEMEFESKENEILTLSTIHSSKGLEWKVVFLIWVLEGRFPSAKSIDSIESIEEERRLFYVACTRAKEYLYFTYPINFFDRESGFVLSQTSRFLDNINDELLDKFVVVEDEDLLK